MSKMRKIALALFVTALPVFAAIPLPTAPVKYVTDAAGVIADDRELALNEKLAQFERDTTNQVIVYVDRKVPEGTTLEEMGAEAIKTWAIGQVRKDNGAILFLFIDDRESRIEVGYGLEGTLTDARSKRILVGMRDALRAGDYAAAVEGGAGAILETIRNPQDERPQPVRRTMSQPVDTTPAPTWWSSLVSILMGTIFFVAIAAFIIGILILIARSGGLSSSSSSDSSSWPSSSNSSSNDSFSSFTSSSGSSSSSSSSSSSFSGGGGSGGGGGASDKW